MPAIRRNEWAPLIFFTCLVSPFGAQADDWTTFGRSPARNGYNPTETTLNAQTVQTIVPFWSTPLNGPLLTQPLILSGVTNVPGTSGPTDLIYAADLTGLAVTLNAQTGAAAANCGDTDLVALYLDRVMLRPKSVVITIRDEGDPDEPLRALTIPWEKPSPTRRRETLVPKTPGSARPFGFLRWTWLTKPFLAMKASLAADL